MFQILLKYRFWAQQLCCAPYIISLSAVGTNDKSHKWRCGFIAISVVKLGINKEIVIMQHK